jgi:hypothetical protein
MEVKTIEIIWYVISGLLGLATAIAGIFAGKNGKGENTEKGKHVVYDYLCQVMCEVEKFPHFTGAEKRDYAMTKVNQFCIDNKLKFDPELTAENIEKMINFSKEVNHGKSKEHRL